MLRKNSGFSLMELMVTIAIIAILASIATPNMIDWLSRSKQRTSARDVLSAIELGRMTAIRRNATATVTFAANTVTVTVTEGGATTTVRTARLASGVSLVQPGAGAIGAVFTFNPQGIPSGSGNVLIRDGKHADKAVQVSVGGNVRILA
jgi:type IV fimbrial biogenesis protein FimT